MNSSYLAHQFDDFGYNCHVSGILKNEGRVEYYEI
ncbi:hypothetical protein Dtox_0396 [Desulfofarcimen acetoxidans DSM 771]|uniref:Uncharacterized protein n=1 Tax=Desulfofarcimen acetoxidans (strain ATCC 49208 / DSM 771 / KCTC 5769 / VKM B-1644 / 5575) TaxID=485916 RepID=C8W4Y8_DESAS|nr:hypothetical protein Dtox_0396 [Desulfofarcimen acetoxidans DSM 771]